jgi:hypothetical protein
MAEREACLVERVVSETLRVELASIEGLAAR